MEEADGSRLLLARSFAIVITDDVGMGIHDSRSPQFLNRNAGGAALIDAALSSAAKLPGTSLDPHGPVAFWGWLAGAHAALSAAELAANYGPELHRRRHLRCRGTNGYRGSPARDGRQLPGRRPRLCPARNHVVLSCNRAAHLGRALTPRGVEMLTNTGRQCLLQTGIDYMFRHIQFWFKQDIFATAATEPFKSLLWAQRIGNVKPTGPCLSDAQPVGSHLIRTLP